MVNKFLTTLIKIILIIFAIIGVIFVGITIYKIASDKYPEFDFTFYIEETGEPLDGNVYLDEIFLGTTNNGVLHLDNISILHSGELKFNGTYKGIPFEFYYEFYKDFIEYGTYGFVVSLNELKELSFDASKLDLRKIEREIFNLVNLERKKYPAAGMRELRWNDKIAEISRRHSQDMLKKEYFAHKTLENVETLETTDFKERLKKEKIFYLVSGENLALISVNSSTNIAKEAIEGWLKSPSHRSTLLDLDNLYSDAGVGIACSKNICYITLDLISLMIVINEEMKRGYCWFVPLYEQSLPFDFDVKAKIKLNSTEKIDFYIVKNDSAVRDCIYRRKINAIKEYKDVNKLEDEITLSKENGVLISTPYSNTNLTIFVDYIN
ncbi:MAG: CAP domain-containing protein [Candidatus Pacearchaeota archaeon]